MPEIKNNIEYAAIQELETKLEELSEVLFQVEMGWFETTLTSSSVDDEISRLHSLRLAYDKKRKKIIKNPHNDNKTARTRRRNT